MPDIANPNILYTDRLQLRPLEMSDVPAVYAFANNYDVVKMTATWAWPLTLAETTRRLEEIQHFEPTQDVVFGIERAGKLIGSAGVHHMDAATFFVGYMLGVEYWGQGYASEAVLPLMDYGFETMQATRLIGEVALDNPASMRVLEKAGFARQEATQMTPCTAQGKEVECAIFALDRKDR